ncbi:MAG: aminotransferase class III-fold pyridoxal phosphate-dependent enzyme [Polyangiaceae bacterium]
MFCYGHSFCGNPLGAAVATEVLRVMREERVVEGVAARAELIAAAVARMGSLPHVSAPRSLGMIGAIDIASTGSGYLPNERASASTEAASGTTWNEYSYLGDAGWRVYDEGLKRGAYLRPLGNVSYIAPPLNISLDDLDELLSIWEASVTAVVRSLLFGVRGRGETLDQHQRIAKPGRAEPNKRKK